MLGKKKWKQWAKRVSHGMTQTNKRIRELEKKENKLLKGLLSKELEGKLKTIVKKD
jgi:hypothetical protein